MEKNSRRSRPQSSLEEFERFEELARKLVSVPKKDIQKEEDKFRRIKKGSEKVKRG